MFHIHYISTMYSIKSDKFPVIENKLIAFIVFNCQNTKEKFYS